MRNLFAGFGILLTISQATAADNLSLNDLPKILYELRGCTEVKGGFLSGSAVACSIRSEDLWASVDSTGSLTLFRKRSYGDTTYARGKTVNEVLRDFARNLNDDTASNKAMLEVLAPHLATQ